MTHSNKQFFPTLFSFSLLISLFFMPQSEAQAQTSTLNLSGEEVRTEVSPRVDHNDAIRTITTRENSVDLLLTDHSIHLQFTDSFLKEIEEDIYSKAQKEGESGFVGAIISFVAGGVTSVMNRSVSIPLSEIGSMEYENGIIVIWSKDGSRLFEDVKIDENPLLESFRPRDARRFVRDAERALI
ncbi:MAG: hypothetical protein JJU46_12850 [Balneolaceae bacterium]|nr:hypothetical protein [Balneolaceae bacterium]MCH8547707.1 hypothetical protein [Balneolaceae bacterium]